MKQIQSYITGVQQTLERLSFELIEEVIAILQDARIQGRQVFIMGNGGSASTASHFVADLAKNTRKEGYPSFRAIGLTDNMAIFSAYANDEGYESVFAQQLANLVHPQDVVIGISASGNSKNVLNAIELANRVQATTIGFTGFDGGKLGPLVDIHVHVPSDIIEQVEDIHLVLEHLICKTLREKVQRPLSIEPATVIMKELSTKSLAAQPEEIASPEDPDVLDRDHRLHQGLEEGFLADTKEHARSSLELWYKLSKAIEPNVRLHDNLHQLLELIMEGIGASSGSYLILDEEGEVSEVALAYQGQIRFRDSGVLEEIKERGLAGWVMENRRAALVNSTLDDPRWLPSTWDNHGNGSRSAISVPLLKQERVVGVLTLVNTQAGKFAQEDLVLLTAIAVYISFHSSPAYQVQSRAHRKSKGSRSR